MKKLLSGISPINKVLWTAIILILLACGGSSTNTASFPLTKRVPTRLVNLDSSLPVHLYIEPDTPNPETNRIPPNSSIDSQSPSFTWQEKSSVVQMVVHATRNGVDLDTKQTSMNGLSVANGDRIRITYSSSTGLTID